MDSNRPGTPRLLRAINDGAALRLLLEHGRLSRTELGALTGLSKPTASQMLSRLEESGLVISVGSALGGPGRSAELYEVNPAAGHVAALDVTPGRIRAAIVDFGGRSIAELEVERPRGERDAVSHVGDCVRALLDSAHLLAAHLDVVVIGVPASYDRTSGTLSFARHLEGWRGPNLEGAIAADLQLPVQIENDVNLVALAEHHGGAAAGSNCSILLWSGSGVGAATVIEGRLHRGSSGAAGEIGFLPMPAHSLVHQAARHTTGAFERACGARAIIDLGRRSGLRGTSPAALITNAVQEMTPRSDAFLDQLAERYATAIAAMISIIDPDLLVLAGPAFRSGGESLRARVQRSTSDLAMRPTPIRLGQITKDPVLTGAKRVALTRLRETIFANPFGSSSSLAEPRPSVNRPGRSTPVPLVGVDGLHDGR